MFSLFLVHPLNLVDNYVCLALNNGLTKMLWTRNLIFEGVKLRIDFPWEIRCKRAWPHPNKVLCPLHTLKTAFLIKISRNLSWCPIIYTTYLVFKEIKKRSNLKLKVLRTCGSWVCGLQPTSWCRWYFLNRNCKVNKSFFYPQKPTKKKFCLLTADWV